MINKEEPKVDYDILTPLEEYQKRRADKNKTIEGANWSKYISFIVFRGNHKLPIYRKFKTSSYDVSAVDNSICI